jgi:hypothetical protein
MFFSIDRKYLVTKVLFGSSTPVAEMTLTRREFLKATAAFGAATVYTLHAADFSRRRQKETSI